MRYFITLLISFLALANAHAQNVETSDIQWEGGTSIDLQSNTSIISTTTVVTRHSATIEFTRDNASLTFDVTSVTGQWQNVSLNGTITYSVEYQDRPGSITITRSNGTITVLLDFTATAPDALKQKVNVDNFQTLNQ